MQGTIPVTEWQECVADCEERQVVLRPGEAMALVWVQPIGSWNAPVLHSGCYLVGLDLLLTDDTKSERNLTIVGVLEYCGETVD